MALKRVSFATAHNASEFTSARWNFQPVPDGFGNAPIQLVEIAPGNPRFAYDPATGEAEGILIEGQRTNLVPNNSMVGATAGVLGAGGSLPTGWTTAQNNTGLQVEVLGTGTDKGLPYLEVRINGTITTEGEIIHFTYLPTYDLVDQSVNSCFLRLTAGDLGGMIPRLRMSTLSSQLSLSAEWQRLSMTESTPAQTSARVQFGTPMDSVGRSVDFTFRMAAPQVEVGAFATSPIITSGTAVTRTADIVARTLGVEFNPNEGTFVVELEYSKPTITSEGLLLNVGTTSNGFGINTTLAGNGSLRVRCRTGGVTTLGGVSGDVAAKPGFRKFAISYNNGVVKCSQDGASPATTLGAPSLISGGVSLGFNIEELKVSLLKYEPRAVSDTELQELSRL